MNWSRLAIIILCASNITFDIFYEEYLSMFGWIGLLICQVQMIDMENEIEKYKKACKE